MDNKVDFIIDIVGNAEEKLNRIVDKLEGSTGAFGKLGKQMVSLNAIMSVAQTAFNAVSSCISKVIDTGSSAELQLSNLTTLYKGNADAAQAMYERLSKYSKETVYDKSGLLDAQKTMMSFGIEGEKAFSTIKQIGDIAMGDSQKMQSLSLAFSQATSTGKLMGQDLLQMINAGFNPLSVISEKTGRSIESLKDDMSKGKISAEQLSQAFQWATEEGGLFYKGAEKAAGTTAGKINVLKGSFDEFLVSVFNKVQPIVNKALTFAINFLENAPSLIDSIMSKIKPFIDMVWTGVTEIGNSIQRLSPYLEPVKDAIENHVLPAIRNIWDKTTKLVKSVIDFVAQSEILRDLWDGIVWVFERVWDAISNGMNILSWVWDNVLKPILIGIDRIYQGFKAAFSELLKPIKAIWAFWQRITGNKAKLEIEENTTTNTGNNSSTQDSIVAAVNAPANAGNVPNSSTNSSTQAVATGGTRNTQITINLGKFMDNMVFNGGYDENRQDIEQHFREMLLRTLYAAQIS